MATGRNASAVKQLKKKRVAPMGLVGSFMATLLLTKVCISQVLVSDNENKLSVSVCAQGDIKKVHTTANFAATTASTIAIIEGKDIYVNFSGMLRGMLNQIKAHNEQADCLKDVPVISQ